MKNNLKIFPSYTFPNPTQEENNANYFDFQQHDSLLVNSMYYKIYNKIQ